MPHILNAAHLTLIIEMITGKDLMTSKEPKKSQVSWILWRGKVSVKRIPQTSSFSELFYKLWSIRGLPKKILEVGRASTGNWNCGFLLKESIIKMSLRFSRVPERCVFFLSLSLFLFIHKDFQILPFDQVSARCAANARSTQPGNSARFFCWK